MGSRTSVIPAVFVNLLLDGSPECECCRPGKQMEETRTAGLGPYFGILWPQCFASAIISHNLHLCFGNTHFGVFQKVAICSVAHDRYFRAPVQVTNVPHKQMASSINYATTSARLSLYMLIVVER